MLQDTQPGRVIAGRYRLIRELGAGGSGQVWAAHDQVDGVDVAVKEVWLPPVSGKERSLRLARAEREARHAALLPPHPHIVTVQTVVIDQETPWVVMQLVDGRSLAQVLEAEGALQPDRVTEIARGLLEALAVAHAAGIVHRDVKPSNVMVAQDGTVLLADFGIAVHDADTAVTTTGAFLGSAEYTAPERVEGRDGHPASDLFSLGVTLYQAVEGVSPFSRDLPIGSLYAVVNHEPPAPRTTGPLAALIMRLLTKDPDQRPTAEEGLRHLDGGINGRPADATTGIPVSAGPQPPVLLNSPAGPTSSSGSPRRRIRPRTAAVAGAVVTVVAVAVAVLVGSSTPWAASGKPSATPSTAPTSPRPGNDFTPIAAQGLAGQPSSSSPSPTPTPSSSPSPSRVSSTTPGAPAVTAAPTVPAGFSVAVKVDGSDAGPQVDGKVTLNAAVSAHGVISSLHYSITGPNGYATTIAGATEAGDYRAVWDSTGLPAGRYSVQAVTNEVDNGTYYWPQAPAAFRVGICRADNTGSYATVAQGILVDSCVSVSADGVVTATVRFSNPQGVNAFYCVSAIDGKTSAGLGWSGCGPWTTSTGGAFAHTWQPPAGTSFRIAVGFWAGNTFYGKVESPEATAP